MLDPATEAIAAAADVTLLGYSPLLSGAYTRTDRPLPAEYDTPETGRQLDTLRVVAEEVGLDAGQVVLAWMNQRPSAVLPVVGVSQPEQVRSAWQAVTANLPEDAVAHLDAART